MSPREKKNIAHSVIERLHNQKVTQWNAFLRNAQPTVSVGDLSSVIAEISGFLMPLIEKLHDQEAFALMWSPDRGWVAAD